MKTEFYNESLELKPLKPWTKPLVNQTLQQFNLKIVDTLQQFTQAPCNMNPDNPVSRQRRYQIRNQAKGLCIICAKPVANGSKQHCEHHSLSHADRILIKYRQKRGISLDIPVKKTKPRSVDPEWKTEKFFAVLGQYSDNAVAKHFKVAPSTASYHRRKLGIAPYRKHK